jgi:polyhydroxybutyrate depolymerase
LPILAAAVAVAAGVLVSGASALPRDVCSPQQRTREHDISFVVDGVQRSAVVHVPQLPRYGRMSLVLAFHGAGGSGRSMERYSGLSDFADRNRFVVVYPDAALPHRTWNLTDSDPAASRDVVFVSRLLDLLQRTLCVDPAKVYATGVSNGGGLVARLGCELSSRFTAIAIVAGGYRSLPPCNPSDPVSVLEIHGTADSVVPYDGRPPDYGGSVPRFLGGWADRDGCPPGDPPHYVAPFTQRFAWGPCAGETAIEHLKLDGEGHTWPGSDGSTAAVSASREVWLFFRGHVRPPAGS